MDKPYRHIIWDWNGTLLDDTDLCIDVMNGLLQQRNLPLLTRERYRAIFDFPVRDYYERLGFDFEQEPFEISGTAFIEAYEQRRDESPLHRQAAALIEDLHRHDVTQSIVSAYRQDALEDAIRQYGLAPFLDGVVGHTDHYAAGKKERGKQWVSKLPYPKNQILFVGDTTHDYEVARYCEIDSLLVAHGHQAGARLEACGVPVIPNLSELPAIMPTVFSRPVPGP